MAEINNHQEEPTLPSKRKPDADTQEPPNKVPKLANLDHKETQEPNPDSNDNNSALPSTENCSSEKECINDDDNELKNDDKLDDDDDDEDEDEDEDEDDSNDEAEVDRKGKGVLRDDKGKGKLIEEEDDDDDDSDDDDSDSDDGGGASDADSDFSDDPLAEVDLNNILPSRTRRRTAHSGLHIASDTGNAGEDDDDSDDSDA